MLCDSGGGADTSQPVYGMTSAISLAGPTAQDLTLSTSLEETLRSFDMFETNMEMALR
jgi:poly(A) polymerase Pap1